MTKKELEDRICELAIRLDLLKQYPESAGNLIKNMERLLKELEDEYQRAWVEKT